LESKIKVMMSKAVTDFSPTGRTELRLGLKVETSLVDDIKPVKK